MIRTKHNIHLKGNFLPRKKQMRWMEDKLSRTSILYLYGAAGCGKTVAGKLFLNSKDTAKKIYLLLDEYENDTRYFMENLLISISQTGLSLKDAGEYEDASFLLFDFAKAMEASEDTYYIFLDQIHVIWNEEIRKSLFYFMDYLPENCYLILAGHYKLPKIWEPLAFSGKISFGAASDLLYDKREIRSYFQMLEMQVPDNQISRISRITAGWPGVISMIGTARMIDQEVEDKIRIYLDAFIEKCLWQNLNEKEKQILLNANMLPFFDESLLLEAGMDVVREDLDELLMKGLLSIHFETGCYCVSSMIKGYLERHFLREIGLEESRLLKERAALWLEERGYLKEMLVMLENPQRIEDALVKYVEEIPGKVSLETLIDVLKICSPLKNGKEKLFLSGYVAARLANEKHLDENETKLYDLWLQDQSDWKILEYYLNLKYWDYRLDICGWMELVKNVWKYPNKIHLYSYSGSCPVILSGVKNYAELFIRSGSEKRKLIRIWNEYMDDEAQLALEIADYDYQMQTQRYTKVYEQMYSLCERVLNSGHGELLAGLYYLLCFFQDKKFVYDFVDERVEVKNVLKQSRYLHVWQNSIVLDRILGPKGKEDEMIFWMLYDAPEEKERNLADNPYLLLLKARCYYKLRQYKKAAKLCSKLYLYYEKRNITQYQAECLFEQAAVLYEDGEKRDAFGYAAKALILGTKYRYIDLYTYYGATGLALVEEYQMVTGVKASEKKQYYYGNILKADYGTFQQILLRCVKKGKRGTSQIEQSDELDLNRLTMTETAILSYINQGYPNKEIADIMNIKLTTVKNHIYNIYRKMGVSTRVQAVNTAKKKGILQ